MKTKTILEYGIWVGGKKIKRVALEFKQTSIINMFLGFFIKVIYYCMSYFWKRMAAFGFTKRKKAQKNLMVK